MQVYYRRRRATARSVELLPNGLWRADLVCGLVALYHDDPCDNPAARQL